MRSAIPKIRLRKIRCEIAICLCLVIAGILPYCQVTTHEFVSYDDKDYVSQNPHVTGGLTMESVRWAFALPSRSSPSYWHPVTWLSHMLDCLLFGLDPGMHHAVNLVFHILNTLLLFLVLIKMTGETWTSAAVASIFALHPINVESVAWVAERKNLLSAFFWMLTMLLYALHVKKPSFVKYVAALLMFVLGLLAKPVLVTLPFVLVLTDFWPLGRIRLTTPEPVGATNSNHASQNKPNPKLRWDLFFSSMFRSVVEKIPFFVLSAVFVFLSMVSARRMGVMLTEKSAPMGLRIENAVISYVEYIFKMLWPQDLAFLYPWPVTIPAWQTIASAVIVMAMSVAVLRCLTKAPYLAVGWFWYVGTLLPVIGLVQQGFWPRIADRFAYVPFIGLYLMMVWGAQDLLKTKRFGKHAAIGVMAVVLPLLTMTSFQQTRRWKNDIALFEQAVSVTKGNYLAHNNLGNAYFRENRQGEAVRQYALAISALPEYAEAHGNLGAALIKMGKFETAIPHLKEALRLNPGLSYAKKNLEAALRLKAMASKKSNDTD